MANRLKGKFKTTKLGEKIEVRGRKQVFRLHTKGMIQKSMINWISSTFKYLLLTCLKDENKTGK